MIRLSIKSFLLLAVTVLSTNAWGNERPRVVATLPILHDFVQVIGQERVAVKSLLTGLESEHTYTPKPTDILAVKQADLLVTIGLGLETWVDQLIRNSGNTRLHIVSTSEGIGLIKDVSGHEDQNGHEHDHAAGNPHIWLDPDNAKIMVRHIVEALTTIDPEGKTFYENRFSSYSKELDRLGEAGKRKVQTLSDRRIVTHHAAWPYFAKKFGFVIEGNLLNQVGSEPSAKMLAALTRKIKREKIKVIVSEPQLNPKLPQIVAQETNARVVVLTPLPGAITGTETYLAMIEYNINQLVDALSR